MQDATSPLRKGCLKRRYLILWTSRLTRPRWARDSKQNATAPFAPRGRGAPQSPAPLGLGFLTRDSLFDGIQPLIVGDVQEYYHIYQNPSCSNIRSKNVFA